MWFGCDYMKFKSSYFKNMYSFGPTDYDLKFMHYYIDMKESDKIVI